MNLLDHLLLKASPALKDQFPRLDYLAYRPVERDKASGDYFALVYDRDRKGLIIHASGTGATGLEAIEAAWQHLEEKR